MINWSKIADSISEATQTPFVITRTSPISGGYTNQSWHLEGKDIDKQSGGQKHYFVKLNSADKASMFAVEQAGLSALAATHTIRVPLIIAYGVADLHAYIVLEYFDLYHKGSNLQLGSQLADLHHVQAAQFGWHQNNTLSLTPQYNTWSSDWLSFWRDHRLGFQLELAAHNGFTGKLQELGRGVKDALPDFFADYRPEPSLLHGDLWGGNYAFLGDGTPVIFDPAPYFGDRETDIVMTELFGGFDPEFYTAYDAAYPLDAGYKKRKTLYNLYHILNHCNLVGSSYLKQAEGMMQRLLKI